MRQLLAFRQSFDPLLRTYLQKRLTAYTRSLRDDFISSVLQYSQNIVFEGGKRIRPYLANVGHALVKERAPASIARIFFALELFHVFALVHDDIMDQGMSRHGIPTTHIYVASALKKKKRMGDIERAGESQAILLGDLLLAWSNELVSGSYATIPPKAMERARRLFFEMIDDVVVGQMLDVDLMTRKNVTLPTIEQKMLLKTASYTFIKPLQIGAALAGGSPALLSLLGKAGEALGLAFQVQDDLLDIIAPPKEVKKTVFSDIADRQHTVFTFHILKHGNLSQKRELHSMLGSRLSEADRPRVMKLFLESGAVAYGEQLMQRYFSDADKAVRALRAPKKPKEELLEFIEYVRHRSS